MHAGELVEFAKQIQIEELRSQLAVQYPAQGVMACLNIDEPAQLQEQQNQI